MPTSAHTHSLVACQPHRLVAALSCSRAWLIRLQHLRLCRICHERVLAVRHSAAPPHERVRRVNTLLMCFVTCLARIYQTRNIKTAGPAIRRLPHPSVHCQMSLVRQPTRLVECRAPSGRRLVHRRETYLSRRQTVSHRQKAVDDANVVLLVHPI